MKLFFIFGAALVVFLLDTLLAQIALRVTEVPKGFPPFTALPILSGVVGGFLLAAITYAVLQLVTPQANRVFFFVAIAALALSFALPIRLSFTKSARFAGVTPAAQMFLALMHTVVATGAVTALTVVRR